MEQSPQKIQLLALHLFSRYEQIGRTIVGLLLISPILLRFQSPEIEFQSKKSKEEGQVSMKTGLSSKMKMSIQFCESMPYGMC
jgi:hypothetical protein